MRINSLLLIAIAFTACATNVKVDPEGYACNATSPCPKGYACVSGACRLGSQCQGSNCGVACTLGNCAPSTVACVDTVTLRRTDSACNEVSGLCEPQFNDTVCANGCKNNACTDDACKNTVCNMPPAPTCDGANRIGSGAASCQMGVCSYEQTKTACAQGCKEGACIGDPCLGVVCMTPPGPSCVGSDLKTYQVAGTCQAGKCDYAVNLQPCPNGCQKDACLATPPLTFSQIGPRIPFEISAVDVQPGSAGNSVVAVGTLGEVGFWNGSSFSVLKPADNVKLNAVQFTGATKSDFAFAIGPKRTALRIDTEANAVTALNVNGASGSEDLLRLSVGGQLASTAPLLTVSILAASQTVYVYDVAQKTFERSVLPTAIANPNFSSIYVDEFNRTRLAGTCRTAADGSGPCVAFTSPLSTTPGWSAQRLASGATTDFFNVVGPTTTVATNLTQIAAWVGTRGQLYSHFSDRTFSSSPAVEKIQTGADVVALTGVADTAGKSRTVYALTVPTVASEGARLFRIASAFGSDTATELLRFRTVRTVMSPSEAGGVLVAEKLPSGKSNLFRRGLVTNEMLDVGEDFVGASVDGADTLILANGAGDLFSFGPKNFTPSPLASDFLLTAIEARNGTGTLLVGRSLATKDGVALRYNKTTSSFERAGTALSGTVLRSVCRLSDTDAVAVGDAGGWATLAGSPLKLTAVTSGTAENLNAVGCEPGQGYVACGDNGVVLRAQNATIAPISPAWTGTERVRSCALSGGTVYLTDTAGVALLAPGATSWTKLPALSRISSLTARNASDIYVTQDTATGADLWHFNGAAWTRVFSAKGRLNAGVFVGKRLLFAGEGGLVVEGRSP